MASKSLFSSHATQKTAAIRRSAPAFTAINPAGGRAYERSAEEALAQYAVTGMLGDTYYATAKDQLQSVIELLSRSTPEFVAKTAVYARKKGFMKDMPALLVAWLSANDLGLFKKTFPIVIDNGKMLRNFMQIVRSGVLGRKSFGSGPKKAIKNLLSSWSDERLFRESVGQNPSMNDIIRMVHPRPENEGRAALFNYILGKDYNRDQLPTNAKAFLAFKDGSSDEVPQVPFQMLAPLSLQEGQWQAIFDSATWHTNRMNLNTWERHGLLKTKANVKAAAKKLADRAQIEKARVFPYQLFTTYKHVERGSEIKQALVDATQIALGNVPALDGAVVVAIDTSGSMSQSVSSRVGHTSKASCVDVAALIAASVKEKNEGALILPFDTVVHLVQNNDLDGDVLHVANKLSKYGGGGTNCGSPIEYLNRNKTHVDFVIMVSDNCSWADFYFRSGQATGLAAEWAVLKARCPKAKMVLIDLTPFISTQLMTQKDVLNIGGFSDSVFNVMSAFYESNDPAVWTKLINSMDLNPRVIGAETDLEEMTEAVAAD